MCHALTGVEHSLGGIYVACILLACVAFIPWLISPQRFKVSFRSKFLLLGVGLAFAVGVLADLVGSATTHFC